MSNLKIKNSDESERYLKESGAGTDIDPHVPSVNVESMPVTHVVADSGAVTATLATETTKVIGTVNIAAGETHIGEMGGNTIIVGDETTRPADTTAYTAGDAIGATTSDTGTTALRSLAVARVAAGSGYLTKLRLMTDQVACVAVIRVHFYTVSSPAGAIVGDNVAMTLLYANRAQRIGHIDLPALATTVVAGSSNSAASQDLTSRLAFKCAAADTNIYYRLETLTGFTPANAQKFYLEVAAENN